MSNVVVEVAPQPVRHQVWCVAAIIVAGLLVYLNSFAGVLIYDDWREIVGNRGIRSFASIWSNRPLVTLTLVLNYRFGQIDAWGYHLFNLVVHLLAGLTLFGVVRRTLLLERFRETHGRTAHWYAAAIALIWVVHPLQTESVTYVIQRAESMMGLFYLLTIYCLLRGSGSARPWAWSAGAVTACALGMLSKPTMITAPAVVLLFDCVLITRSIRETLRRRWGLYGGLCATWVLLALTGTIKLIFDPDPGQTQAAGFAYAGCTPLEYALTQPGVILHYLKLAVWPHPLCLDYHWPIARRPAEVAGPGLLILFLLSGSLWSLSRWPWVGFLGLSFFLILSPTSSVVPFANAAVEHRMYLPLAAVVTLSVLGGHLLLKQAYARLSLPGASAAWLKGALVIGVAVGYGILTIERNRDYHSKYRMWKDVMTQRPLNPLPYNAIANIVAKRGQTDLAIDLYEQALRLNPHFHIAHNNLGNVLQNLARFEEAMEHYRQALHTDPTYAEAHYNLANALKAQGRLEAALGHYEAALRIRPRYEHAHNNLGTTLLVLGRVEPAITHFQEVLRIEPRAAGAHYNLGLARAAQGRFEQAAGHYRRALQLKPDFPEASRSLAAALRATRRQEPAGERPDALSMDPGGDDQEQPR